MLLGWMARPAAALLFALAACAPSEDESVPVADGIHVVDADGRDLVFETPVRRVVSLVPSATLTLGALGARDLLVARTDFDTVAWAQAAPSVGGGLQPSIEAVVAARPDVVIRFGGPSDPDTPARLDDLGIRHMSIRPDRVADVLSTIRLLGTITGRGEAADSLIEGLERELEAVRASVAGRPRVHAAYVLGGDPPWVAGAGTYIHELIELAGGLNVFADLGTLYAAVSPEQMVARDIDVVLFPPGGTLDRRLVRGARVVEARGDLEIPGPNVGDAARQVARLLHEAPGG